MKKQIQKSSSFIQVQVLVLSFLFISSCELLEVEENFSIKSESTTLQNLDVSFGGSSSFNLSSADGAYVDLNFDAAKEFNSTIEVYISLNSTEAESFLVSSIQTVPTEAQLTIEDVRAAFTDQNEELEDGDVVYFTFRLNLEEESYQFNNTALSASVSCNSMISTAEDSWIGQGTSDNGPSFPSTSTAEDIKIIPLGGDQYLISDISAGWYSAINFRPVQEGIYQDNCNRISWVEAGDNRQFEFVDPGIEGSWDPQSGTLTVYWFDEGNDFSGKSVFTKDE